MHNFYHKPVMIEQAVESLNVRANLNYIDATFGMGSYTQKILERAKCKLISIDQDPEVLVYAEKIKKKYNNNFSFIADSFKNINSIVNNKKLKGIDGGIVADLGFSSMQIENADRGFSFMRDGPLDMRMSKKGQTAKDLIYSVNEKELSDILWKYGEEKQSRAIARIIINARKSQNIDRTFKLVELIKKAKKYSGKSKTHPATKTFQALRISVNHELKVLKEFLEKSEKILMPGARLVIVTFHSLEDRIVKVFFNELVGKESNVNRHLPNSNKDKIIKFKTINRKPLFPDDIEIKKNHRARSAKIRTIERLGI